MRLWALGFLQNEWAGEARKGNKAGVGAGEAGVEQRPQWGLGRQVQRPPWASLGAGVLWEWLAVVRATISRGLPGGTTSACLHISAQMCVRSRRFQPGDYRRHLTASISLWTKVFLFRKCAGGERLLGLCLACILQESGLLSRVACLLYKINTEQRESFKMLESCVLGTPLQR